LLVTQAQLRYRKVFALHAIGLAIGHDRRPKHKGRTGKPVRPLLFRRAVEGYSCIDLIS
jgi:hypothetical protein